jgi:large subunit ribosomal protein L6
MSRVGRLPITIPSGVGIDVSDSHVVVTGPRGTLERDISPQLTLVTEDGQLRVQRPSDEKRARELHGLTRTLINNMVVGVTEGYEKKLLISGTGYRVVAKGRDLEFSLGYSHPVLFPAPEGITFMVESPTRFAVTGIDKQLVGETAAKIRKLRKPDPYKAKGVRYDGEVVRRKAGKAGKK